MRTNLIALVCFALTSIGAMAQELTLEYNFGYGLYNMSDMKGALNNAIAGSLKGVKTTDNFPGNFTNTIKVGLQLKQHQLGVTYTHQNTSGQNHLADYSGEYKLTIKNSGNQLGVFYRFYIQDQKFSPFVELASGTLFCSSTVEEYVVVSTEKQNDKSTLTGINLFVQPTIGVRYQFTPFVAVSASAGYEWNPTGNLHLKGNSSMKSNLTTDWSGFRFNAGFITYFKMK